MFQRVYESVRGIGAALRDAWLSYQRHRGSLLGAGLAFYTLLSVAPLLVVAVAIAGMVFGEGAARAQALRAVDELVGGRAAVLAAEWVDAAHAMSSQATLVGAVLFFFGASRVFVHLESALDAVWEVTVPDHESLRDFLRAIASERLLSFALMLGFGLVIALSLVAQTLLDVAALAIFPEASATMMRIAHLVLSVSVLTLGFALTFRRAPHRHIELRETWFGALVTAMLFMLGNVLLSAYFAYAHVGAAYGAAGSVVAVFAWMAYSSQIVLFGAELTRIVAMRGGRVRVHPTHAPAALLAPPQRPRASVSAPLSDVQSGSGPLAPKA